MSFLHPALLILAALALVPVVFHLFTLYQAKTVELSTFRFLIDKYLRQKRGFGPRDLFLALLRALMIGLIVFFVARPLLAPESSLFPSATGREVLFFVDTSASMNAQNGGVSALQRAKSAAKTLASQLPVHDRVTLVKFSDHAEVLAQRVRPDAPELIEPIDALTVSPAHNDFATALQESLSLVTSTQAPLIYLFSDGQAEASNKPALPPDAQVIVVQVGPREARPNIAVVGDAPSSSRAVVGLPILLPCSVVNYGTSEADVLLTTVIDEREVARQSVTLRPGERTTQRMVYVPEEPGIKRGRFEVITRSPNVFPDDDRYLFTLQATPRSRVLIVSGGDNEALFIRAALGSQWDIEEILEPALTLDKLDNVDAVILANTGTLKTEQFRLLQAFVEMGGGLLVFPGDRVVGERLPQEWFGAELGLIEGELDKPETFERLAVLDLAHPVLSVFEDTDNSLSRSVRVYRRFRLTMTDSSGATRSLARFASGQPALTETNRGQGRVILAAFPAHVRWTNGPLRPEFVPLMLRMTAHVLRRPALEGPAVVVPGGLAEVSMSPTAGDAPMMVTTPSGRKDLLPEFPRSGSRWIANFDQTRERGYYVLEEALAFAVNLDSRESKLESASDEARATEFAGVKWSVIDAEREDDHPLLAPPRIELWAWLVYGLIAFLGLEVFLATAGLGRT